MVISGARFWSVFAGTMLMLLALPGVARAFNYVEHAHISSRALCLAVKGRFDVKTGECKDVDDDSKQIVSATVEHLNSKLNLCRAEWALDDQPQSCFALGDLPALAGDHSASPLLLKWRWFNDNLKPKQTRSLPQAFPAFIYGFPRGTESPERVAQRRPNARAMLIYLRRFAPKNWPLDVRPNDIVLQGYDDSYVTLAERGHPHFRPRLREPDAVLVSERRSYTSGRHAPASHAFAWYADLHLGALSFAKASTRAAPEEQPKFIALALFHELNALHYLEDSFAAGHIVSDALNLNNEALNRTHDIYSELGVRVKFPANLCRALDTVVDASEQLPLLALACKGPPTDLVAVGDHQLMHAGETLQTQWAVFAAAHSISQVLRVITGEEMADWVNSDDLGRCGEPPIETGYTWNSAYGASDEPPDRAFYACSYAWWSGDRSLEDRATLIRDAYERGAMASLEMVPLPVGTDSVYPQDTTFAGNGVRFTSRMLAALDSATPWGGLSIGYAFAGPRSRVPVSLLADVFIMQALSSDQLGTLAGFQAGLLWSATDTFYVGGELAMGKFELFGANEKDWSPGGGIIAGLRLYEQTSRFVDIGLAYRHQHMVGHLSGLQLSFGLN